MPTSLALTLRCQNKSLSPGGTPPIGSATPDGVSVQLQLMAPTGAATQASCQITVPIASDTFIMGGYYAITVADGVVPGGTSVPCPDPAPTTAAPKAPLPVK